MVLVFRFEQLFINKNENVMGQLWQLISGQQADYAPILFLQMKLQSCKGLHTQEEKKSNRGKIFYECSKLAPKSSFFQKKNLHLSKNQKKFLVAT